MRGIACVEKISSAPTGPLSAGDGVDAVDGISSVIVSLDLWNQRLPVVYLDERTCYNPQEQF